MSHSKLDSVLRRAFQFDLIQEVEVVQSLWSGYGQLMRVYLSGARFTSVIVKWISPPKQLDHPRGWNTNHGHLRKLKSYTIEEVWYREYQSQVNSVCRMPAYIYSTQIENETVLVLEDLGASGFNTEQKQVTSAEVEECIKWLARFHGHFLGISPKGLWKEGSYWHLGTREEEWKKMEGGPLKANAKNISQKLQNARFQTLIHGDAKYANFGFLESGEVAAYDFQYVGGGCGMIDVVYLMSCQPEGYRERDESRLLQLYFAELKKNVPAPSFDELEKEWREMYFFAWADFERFLKGWAPGHWKMTLFSMKRVEKALSLLSSGS